MNSFVVELWSRIFYCLGRISLFRAIRWLVPRATERSRFVDVYVLLHLLLSVCVLLGLSVSALRQWLEFAVYYGAFRIFEVFVYQVDVLLFDEYRQKKAGKSYALHGYRRLVVLLLNNYMEMLVWFACWYRIRAHWFANKDCWCDLDTMAGSLYFSIVTMTTLGYGDVHPTQPCGVLVTGAQVLIGVFMAVVMVARFVAYLPRPKTLDKYER